MEKRSRRGAWMCALLAIPLALVDVSIAHADEDLEARVAELEAASRSTGGASWSDHVRVGGSANAGWYGGRQNSLFHETGFELWDAMLHVDAELGNAVRLGDHTVVRNVGMSFEWTILRLGEYRDMVGEFYVELQGIADCDWMNLKVGRFQLPLGENYLRFSRGYRDNPFITNTVGGPWFWDEGIKIYGQSPSSMFSYVASITEGENRFNVDSHRSDFQYTLKLIAEPTSWLRASVSGLYSNESGANDQADLASFFHGGSLWLGETWPRAVGTSSGVPNFVDGVAEPDDARGLDRVWLVGADVVAEWPEHVRVWLAYGISEFDRKGSLFDRTLHYWIAEVILDGALVMPELQDFYLGLRANALGTYDGGEGTQVDYRDAATLGWNVEAQTAYSVLLGWHMLPNVTLRAEYTHLDIDLVRGVSDAIDRSASKRDSGGVEIGVHF